jgi:hypothetical protein
MPKKRGAKIENVTALELMQGLPRSPGVWRMAHPATKAPKTAWTPIRSVVIAVEEDLGDHGVALMAIAVAKKSAKIVRCSGCATKLEGKYRAILRTVTRRAPPVAGAQPIRRS